jgi:putative endonuclease
MKSVFHYVYLLRSIAEPDRHYVGMTTDLETRLERYNGGQSAHTAKFRPWQIDTAIAFRSRDKAAAFEHYLKSHSGRAFAKNHF